MSAMDGVAASLGRRLEAGVRSPFALAASALWGAAADPVRRLALPAGATVVAVGGATLGGSGKTPVVLAIARVLASGVAVVGHAHGARPGRARVVRPDDAIGIVGDDALWLARALDGTGTHVVVAPCRADALLLAAKLAPRIVVDGLLQARPRRVAVGILVLDAARPWGAGACPPAGDLRAPRRVLEAVADCRLVVGGTPSAEVGEHAVARVESRGAFAPDGTLLPWSVLAATRIGVLLGVARPERILCTLGSRGIRPAAVSLLADHAPPGAFAVAAASHPRPDAWLVTSKCRVKLAATLCGAPVLEIEHELELPPALQKRLLAA